MTLNLTGQLIKLRPLQSSDLEAIQLAYTDLDLQLITDGDSPPLTDVQVQAFWEEIIANPGANLRYFAIETTGENAPFVGACSLQQIDLRNRHAELSVWMVSSEQRGQGYGTEAVRLLLGYAFDVLRLDKVYLGVYDFNEGGLRVYERVGFHYEGRLQNMLHYEGRYWDEWPMRMLRNEWKRSTQAPAEGLRFYHPSDLDAAIGLLLQERSLSDKETARAILRRWWRQIDRVVYSYQVDGQLVGLATVTTDGDSPQVLDVVVREIYDTAFVTALREL
ncbi:MAG: GNAT family N-acetyltransferase [Anaerolineaceae bacterium]|nr:GNAT family N-acetyltransferase [Anaerolineaceae bacterium]